MFQPVTARSHAMAAPPPGYEEIHRSEFARMFGRIIGARLYVAPIVAALAVALGLWEPTPWRRLVLVVLASGMVLLSIVEARRYRRVGMTPRAADLNLAAGVVGQLVGSAATGGLESPFLPLMLLLTLFLSMIMVERPWYYWALTLLQLGALWAFGAIAVSGEVPAFNLAMFGGGARGGHSDVHLWAMAALMSCGVLMAAVLGRGLRKVFDSMLWRALEANEQLRVEQMERMRSLAALSGEIAHELKNPMASVKGLSALLEKSVGEGKAAERLAVLRQEIDRMQGILEEFLNFSRPLVPLTLERADLAAICEEVAALHEGLARERGIEVTLALASAPVRCDPRKVKQVLMNLLQNAIDASPAGRAIELTCASTAGTSTARVLDRGPGLDPRIAGRLFEPGATTKPRGTGLGLTIARSIARQHGGELALGPREGGGCVAELKLPVEPLLPKPEEASA